MTEKKRFFYAEMADGERCVFATPEDFLEFVATNDPGIAGCDPMTQEEFDALEEFEG